MKRKLLIGLGLVVIVLVALFVFRRGDDPPFDPANNGSEPGTVGTRPSGTVAGSETPAVDPTPGVKPDDDSTTDAPTEMAQTQQGPSGELTTSAQAAAEEAETRARERYEQAQANAYQFRKTDPGKIVATPVMAALTEAAQKYSIPQEILTALMAVESGGAHRDGDHSMEGGYGVMNLKENNLIDTLGEAANLIGKTKEEVLYDQKLNIEAAAALLARYHEDALASGVDESEAWYIALSQYSGRPNPELAAALADEVAGMIMRGYETELDDGGGKVALPPNPKPPFYPKNWRLAGVTPPAGTPASDGTAAGDVPDSSDPAVPTPVSNAQR